MSVTQSQREAAHRIAHEIPDIDQGLPIWARRRNPIILRMLGEHWRVFFPQARPLIKLFVVQSLIILATIKYSWVYILILTFLMPVLVALPYAFYVYIQAIGRTISLSTLGIVTEYEHDTMRILRTTPFSTREIVLSKISAAVWRQADDVDQLLFYASSLSMPVLLAIYLADFSPDVYPNVTQFLAIASFAASILRIPLELFMIASVGTMMGAFIHSRSTSFLATAVLVFFYFLLTNLLRLVDMDWPLQLLVDAGLPLLLPALFSYLAIWATVRQIEAD